jgi:hypothetical protein
MLSRKQRHNVPQMASLYCGENVSDELQLAGLSWAFWAKTIVPQCGIPIRRVDGLLVSQTLVVCDDIHLLMMINMLMVVFKRRQHGNKGEASTGTMSARCQERPVLSARIAYLLPATNIDCPNSDTNVIKMQDLVFENTLITAKCPETRIASS